MEDRAGEPDLKAQPERAGRPAKPAPAAPDPLGVDAHELLDASLDPLYALSPEGSILTWNWGAETLYGTPAAQAIGRPFSSLFAPARAEENDRAIKEALETGSALLQTARRTSGGGEVLVQALYKRIARLDACAVIAVWEHDVTEARRLEQELSEQVWSLTEAQDFLRSILEASIEYSIIAVDLERRVRAWNPGARHDFGHEAADVVGHPLDEAVTAQGPQAALLEACITRALVEGGEEAEILLGRKSGERFPARITASPRRDAFGSAVGAIVIIKDLTDERRTEGERRVALERLLEIKRLQEVDQIRTRLLNSVAHELVTPLTPMRIQVGVLHAAAAGPDPKAALQKALPTIERNLSRLADMVRDIVLVARLEGGNQSLEKAHLDLADLVKAACGSLAAEAASAGVTMRFSGTGPLPVEADPAAVGQVMQAIAGNAVKFTPAGGRVEVRWRRDGPHAVVEVEDTGAGIPPEDLGRLFQPFVQLHDTMQRTRSGTGIGLFVAKRLATLQGGDITVTSGGPGKGSTFRISIPLHAGRRTQA